MFISFISYKNDLNNNPENTVITFAELQLSDFIIINKIK